MSKCVQCALVNSQLEHKRHPNQQTRAIVEYQKKRRKALKGAELKKKLCAVHFEGGEAREKKDTGPSPKKAA